MNKQTLSDRIAQNNRKVVILPENESKSQRIDEDDFFDSEAYLCMLDERDERQANNTLLYMRNF